jgi:hypothetical protein
MSISRVVVCVRSSADGGAIVLGNPISAGPGLASRRRGDRAPAVPVKFDSQFGRVAAYPKFGFTKSDMSDKVASYFDLSYLSEATGKPIDELSLPAA